MKIIVHLGTGGVGKTSVAAATALNLARNGTRTLILTTDPSYRLRTALRLENGLLEQQVPVEGAKAELWAAMLDVRATLDEAVRLHGKKDKQEAILNHPIYASIASSLSGMQELMAVERIDQLMRRGFETIVVDTAPSRHGLDLIDKPTNFAALSAARRVKLVGRTYKFVEALGLTTIGRSALNVYKRAEEMLGAELVRQVLDFYSLFFPIAEGYSERAKSTVELLQNAHVTEFRVVTTPPKCVRDASFFIDQLATRGISPEKICVNRAWMHPTPDTARAGLESDLLAWYASVSQSHREAIEQLKESVGSKAGTILVFNELERDVDGLEALEQIAAQIPDEDRPLTGAAR
jgi:anion-transporting  ArsA/GET3 family ATPase